MKYTTLALCLLAMSGCTSQPGTTQSSINDHLGLKALQSSDKCCLSLNQLDYQKVIKPEAIKLTLTDNSPIVELKSGKSFAYGLALPNAIGTIDLTVYSVVEKKAFVPSVLILDENHKVLDVIDSSTIKYSESTLLYRSGFIGEYSFPVLYPNSVAPKYLLVVTTTEALSQSTAPMPPSEFALQSGQVSADAPFYSTNKIPHSAIGDVTIEFRYNPDGVIKESEDQKGQREKAVSEFVENDQVSTISRSDEELYNTQIRKAVTEGDFEKALKISEEAQKKGSSTSKQTFIDAMKGY